VGDSLNNSKDVHHSDTISHRLRSFIDLLLTVLDKNTRSYF